MYIIYQLFSSILTFIYELSIQLKQVNEDYFRTVLVKIQLQKIWVVSFICQNFIELCITKEKAYTSFIYKRRHSIFNKNEFALYNFFKDMHNSWLYCYILYCSETRVPSSRGIVKQYNKELCISSNSRCFTKRLQLGPLNSHNLYTITLSGPNHSSILF